MKIRNKEFDMKSPDVYIMGILNITPDSFSDGGRYVERDDILSHAEEMISAGADIIDIGGESTRPGYQPVTEQEEIERVCNAIDVIRGEFDVPISVDTYKAAVMDQCLKAGADIANDIWGLRYDLFNPSGINHASLPSQMAEVVKKYDVPVVVMHNDNMTRSLEERTSSGVIEEYAKICGVSMDEATKDAVENSVLIRVIRGLQQSIDIALQHGIDKDKIILDPGVGFAKTDLENRKVLKALSRIVEEFDYTVLLGASRKSVIGNALQLPADEREEGTLVTTLLAAEAGCKFVRVHDVEKNARALKMYRAIYEA
ncbi:MAG TPA: dihydropteroate synthase [Lachnospiraceae bacterium]|nr:dihydropteroate synthase [Lachnospiraceae bacterium]